MNVADLRGAWIGVVVPRSAYLFVAVVAVQRRADIKKRESRASSRHCWTARGGDHVGVRGVRREEGGPQGCAGKLRRGCFAVDAEADLDVAVVGGGIVLHEIWRHS